jgi:hypothetical protein
MVYGSFEGGQDEEEDYGSVCKGLDISLESEQRKVGVERTLPAVSGGESQDYLGRK